MKLTDVKMNNKYRIVGFDDKIDGDFVNRLLSMGIGKGVEFVTTDSSFKGLVTIYMDNKKICIRNKNAALINVEEINE